MPPQEIPGFYFDEVKKRYFRITNGDQRHNGGYSNNSIQANKRRKRILAVDASERTSKASTQADLVKYHPTSADLLVNFKLGLASIPSGWPVLSLLQRCTHLSTLIDGKCWMLEDNQLIFRFDGGDVLVYKFHSILEDPYAPSVGYIPGNGGSEVEDLGQANNIFYIKYANNDLIAGEFTSSGTQLSMIHGQPGNQTCQACVTDQGIMVLLGHKFEIFSFSGHREKLAVKWHGRHPADQMLHQNGVLAVAGNKCVTIICHSLKYMHILKHKTQVHRVFLDDMTLRPDKVAGKYLEYARLTVVTTDTIFLYMIDFLTKKGGVTKAVQVKIANDNIAVPIVLRIEQQLLVEISGERFTWINLESRRAQTILLPCFASARSPNQSRQWNRSSFFVFGGRYFVLTSSGLYEFMRS